MNSLNLKQNFLYLLIGSVGLSVIIGIFVVLVGSAEQSTNIFLTSLTITAGSFSMFLNGVFFERLRMKILPFLGIFITLAAALLCVVFIWSDSQGRPLATTLILLGANFFLLPMAFYYEKNRAVIIPVLGLIGTLIFTGFIINFILEFTPQPNESATKFAHISYLLALACFYLSLILQVNLDEKFRWSQSAARVVAGTLFIVTSWVVLTSSLNDPLFQTFVGRFIIILIILIAALTVLVPVFYFLSSTAVKNPLPDTGGIDREIAELKARLAELEEKKREMENDVVSAS